MRTVFENTNETETKSGSGLPIVLWVIALLFLVGAFAAYQIVSKRRIDPPPPPVSVKSIPQVNKILYQFTEFVRNGNWDEAQKMLSADGQKKLADAKISFHDSVLAQRKGKDDKVLRAEPTPEEPQIGDNSITQNCVFFFDKNEVMYLPLTIVMEKVGEQDRLAISSWGEITNKTDKDKTKPEGAKATAEKEPDAAKQADGKTKK